MEAGSSSTSETKWRGFKPVGYWLGSKVRELPLTQRADDGKTENATTVGSVHESLKDKEIKSGFLRGDGLGRELVTSDGVRVFVDGPGFSREMLDTMLRLRAEGIDPFMTHWYYYNSSRCYDDGHECHSFFVAHAGVIVREEVRLFNSYYSAFDPSVLEEDDLSADVWSDAEALADATSEYWYRKFYSETTAGQLMVLRPDHPELFYYDEPQTLDINGAIQAIAHSLNGIKTLLWVLVVLSAISLLLRWK